jgi:hypothetical protein
MVRKLASRYDIYSRFPGGFLIMNRIQSKALLLFIKEMVT